MKNRTILTMLLYFFILISLSYLVIMIIQIDLHNKHLKEIHRQQLIELVTMAANVLEPTVEKYRQGKITKKEALNQIRNQARHMTFNDTNGKNYLFMSTWEGINLVQPYHPDNELKNMWYFQDSHGDYVVQSLVRISKNYPYYGFHEYWLNLPGQYKDQKKSAYVLGITELECYIGTGIYLESSQNRHNQIILIILGGSLMLVLTMSMLFLSVILIIRSRTRQLTISEEKFRSLFENMTEGVAIHKLETDSTGKPCEYRILDINPAYTQHTGLEQDMVRNKLACEAYGTKLPPYLKEYGEVSLTRVPFHFETYFPPLDRHFSISVISPQKGYFATVFEDITNQRLREMELQQKNDELVRFTYTVSHDLRSPLVTINAFLGYLENDLKKEDKTRIETDFSYIRSAVVKMGNLLDELLRLSRVGQQNNPVEEFSLQEVVSDAIKMSAGRLTEKGVYVSVTEKPLTLRGDKTRITELFQNLLDNAAKFSSKIHEPKVEIDCEHKGSEIFIRVRDNGIGIDPRHQKRLFGLFEKLDPSTEGNGMGLAIVRRIVEIHGGQIWVESIGSDQGTSFCFTLGGLIWKETK